MKLSIDRSQHISLMLTNKTKALPYRPQLAQASTQWKENYIA
jgi:hypothetical protein